MTHNVREATFLADRVLEISARPGAIKGEYAIHVPRPRTEQDPHLLTIQARIMSSLKDEIDKVAREQLDIETTHRPLTAAERNVGSNI